MDVLSTVLKTAKIAGGKTTLVRRCWRDRQPRFRGCHPGVSHPNLFVCSRVRTLHRWPDHKRPGCSAISRRGQLVRNSQLQHNREFQSL